jgi:hypothetical protein
MLWAVAAALAVGIGVLVCLRSAIPQHPHAAAPVTTAPAGPAAPTTGGSAPAPPVPVVQGGGPGTSVRDGNFEFTVSRIERGVPVIGKVAARGSYTIVTMTVTNVGAHAEFFPAGLQHVVDTTGHSFAEDPLATDRYHAEHKGAGRVGSLGPGLSGTAVIVFDTARDSIPRELDLRAGLRSHGVTVTVR